MMEAVRTSETSADNHFTWQYIPEDNSEHHTHSSLMMEAVRTSETSVDNHFTRQYITEDTSEHRTRRRENLKYRNSSYLIFPATKETSRLEALALLIRICF
jgi:hypothetical protein